MSLVTPLRTNFKKLNISDTSVVSNNVSTKVDMVDGKSNNILITDTDNSHNIVLENTNDIKAHEQLKECAKSNTSNQAVIDEKYNHEFSPPNHYNVRYKYIIACDNKCNGKCVCLTTPNRGIKTLLELKSFQMWAIDWMLNHENEMHYNIHGCINSSRMGLGKTIQVLTLIMSKYAKTDPPLYPSLIIVPFTIINIWIEEINKWFGTSCKFLIYKKDNMRLQQYNTITVSDFRKYHVIITTYETVQYIAKRNKIYDNLFHLSPAGRKIAIKHASYPTAKEIEDSKGEIALFKCPWTYIILDEAHRIADPNIAQTHSIMALYGKRKICITGTPIRNYTSDLFSLLRFIGFDEIISANQFNEFIYRKYDLKKYILYISEADAGIKLPEMHINTIELTLDNNELLYYKKLEQTMRRAIVEFDNKKTSFSNILTLFMRLRQCCAAPYIMTLESTREYDSMDDDDKANNYMQGFINKLDPEILSWLKDKNGTAGIQSTKIKEIIEIVRDKIPDNEKVVIFTSFIRMIDILVYAFKQLCPHMLVESVDGSITGIARTRAINNFKNGKPKVLIITYGTGSLGLNLIEATHSILIDMVWTPSVLQQASTRTHRVGQDKEVYVWHLIIKDTIEQRMLSKCVNKQELFDDFILRKKGIKDVKMTVDIMRKLLS